MKICSKCNVEKEDSEFWKRNNRSRGVNSECKTCCSERRKKNRVENGEILREKRKEYYYKNREKLCESQIESQRGSERYRKYQNAYALKKRKEGDNRYLARQILFLAIKGKMITRPKNCEVCNFFGDIEGHHQDYNKPLDVKWVCKKCHLAIHNGRFTWK